MRRLFLSLIVVTLAFGGCDKNPPPRQPAGESVTVASQASGATSRPAMPSDTKDMSSRQLYVAYCSACHTLDLVESQRLDRAGWEWVMDDAINEYGATWITEGEQAILVDYLVENFGPEK